MRFSGIAIVSFLLSKAFATNLPTAVAELPTSTVELPPTTTKLPATKTKDPNRKVHFATQDSFSIIPEYIPAVPYLLIHFEEDFSDRDFLHFGDKLRRSGLPRIRRTMDSSLKFSTETKTMTAKLFIPSWKFAEYEKWLKECYDEGIAVKYVDRYGKNGKQRSRIDLQSPVSGDKIMVGDLVLFSEDSMSPHTDHWV